MKIISWNVNGIRAISRKGFGEFVQNCDPDVLCLQETKAHPDQLEPELRNLPGRFAKWSWASRRGYSGAATFCKFDPAASESGINIAEYDSEGRFVVTQFRDIKLYNVYFPNGGSGPERHHFKQRFLSDFTDHLAHELRAGQKLIVLGDYNVAYLEHDVHDPKRLSKMSGFLPEERQWFRSFLDIGFVDSFRYFFPDLTEQYTWWDYRTRARLGNKGWRIDHICVSENLKPYLKSARIHADQEGSDHCPIEINLDLAVLE